MHKLWTGLDPVDQVNGTVIRLTDKQLRLLICQITYSCLDLLNVKSQVTDFLGQILKLVKAELFTDLTHRVNQLPYLHHEFQAKPDFLAAVYLLEHTENTP